MGETGESKRDQAVAMACETLVTFYPGEKDRTAALVNLLIDAAKEEIRAELAEQAEERHWRWMKAVADGPSDEILGREFWAEFLALKAKRKAMGKSTD
jgi:hypothetical protein